MTKVDGIDLRNQIAEDYQRNAQRMGSPITADQARDIATSDLMLVDALEREERHSPPAPTSNPEVVPERDQQSAEQMAHEIGGKFERRECPENEPDPETLGNVNLPKRMKLLNRIGELWRRERNGFVYPEYVKAMQNEWANWNFRCKNYSPLAAGGPRTQVERDRQYFNFLENLCNKSNAILPAWWVK